MAQRYVVSYDLRSPGQNYSRIQEQLEAMGGKKILLSYYAVRFDGSPVALRNHLEEYIDSNDRLAVVKAPDGSFASLRPFNTIGGV
ncbi:SinR family protein [bacterium]|nr:SinR family protein [bacterium]